MKIDHVCDYCHAPMRVASSDAERASTDYYGIRIERELLDEAAILLRAKLPILEWKERRLILIDNYDALVEAEKEAANAT